MIMRSTLWNRCVRTGAWLALLGTVVGVLPADATRAAGRPRRPRALRLFATAGLLLDANRVQCGITSAGEVCVSFTGSPVGGGGFWPKGTVDQYIFNSGLQIAAVVERGIPGFAWSGDTVGTFIFDPRDDQVSGEPLTNIYNSLDPDDRAAWPAGAVVRDAAIYHPVLLGRSQVSEQDSWVRYWEGNPALLGGRTHPAGILVEQRSLAWNFPSGNEDIVYFTFTFYNVTASNPAVYSNPTVPPEIQSEIAAAGAQFQQLNESQLGVAIPDDGYVLEDMYAAFAMDADVAQFSHNYSTAFLPFNIGSTYTGDFLPEVGWTFPPDVFGPPLFPAPGFVGVKYLRSPESSPGVQVGLTMFSNTTNGLPFPDAVGVNLLYRRLSGFFGPADVQCNPFTDPAQARARRLCFLSQVQADARFYQASGPFDLPPGEARTIVVAYLHAAPLDIVAPFVGTDVKPGIPFTGDSIAADTTKIRTIDRVAGWVTQGDSNANGVIEQSEVTTAPRSLLHKARVAQAVFDNMFLLPFAPQAPEFYLVPGDNQITVAWQPSRSEADGDPFFTIASQAFDTLGNLNPLYDANFRQFDVEGYRIYRGRTAAELELVAQFDYAGTTFRDFTGALQYGDQNGDGKIQCAPELGLQADCPVTFETTAPLTTFVETPIVGELVQVKTGDRVVLESTPGDTLRGTVLNLKADTVIVGRGSGYPRLNDTGVPFAFVDLGVRNSFTYVYAVAAFDVNSVKSGPSSLESPRITRSVTPRKIATNKVPAGPVVVAFLGAAGDTARGAAPDITDGGTFTGPAAPASGWTGSAALFADQLLQPGGFEMIVRVDSVVPLWYHTATYYLTQQTVGGGGATTTLTFGPLGPLGEEDGSQLAAYEAAEPVTDTALAGQVGLAGLPAGALLKQTFTVGAVTFTSKDADWHPDVSGAFFDPIDLTDDGGSRWFSGTNETMGDPTLGLAHGQLPGVSTIYRPVRIRNASNLFRRFDQTTYHLFRAADIRIYWGSTPGAVDSVVDLTHRVRLPFDPQNRASYGFRTDVTGNAVDAPPDGVLTFNDLLFGACLYGAAGIALGNCENRDYTATAVLSPVDVTGDLVPDSVGGVSSGFGLYLNGEPFLFQTSTLPSNTTWTYRSYFGAVTKTGSTYAFTRKPSNPPITGGRLVVATTQPATYPSTAPVDLSPVHTVPDPYYVTNALEQTLNSKVLKFVKLPAQAIIRIYSVSGVLVAVVVHDDPSGGGEATWNLRNRNNQFVASGVYFFHVETPSGQTRVGRFTIVNFAP
jgi:hypothetical protein